MEDEECGEHTAHLSNNNQNHPQQDFASIAGGIPRGCQQAGCAHHGDACQAECDADVVSLVQLALQESHCKDGGEEDLRAPQHLVYRGRHIPATSETRLHIAQRCVQVRLHKML